MSECGMAGVGNAADSRSHTAAAGSRAEELFGLHFAAGAGYVREIILSVYPLACGPARQPDSTTLQPTGLLDEEL